jgi:hypothetical protein
MSKAKPPINEPFFNSFFGEFVRIVATVGPEPLEIFGFLLHKDETMLYMGSTLEKIDAVVRLDVVILIQVDDGKNIHPILDSLEEPDSDEGFQ